MNRRHGQKAPPKAAKRHAAPPAPVAPEPTVVSHLFRPPDAGASARARLDLPFLALAAAVAAATHLHLLGYPANVVFDEVYFGNFTHHYHRREYFFDIHPPLGKQLLYLGSRLSGYAYGELYSHIGAPLSLSQIRRLRFWPCVTGALRAPLMYGAVRALGASPLWALAVALCVATDQALIAEARFVLIDAYLSMFAAAALLATAVLGRRPRGRAALAAVAAAGAAAGATVAVKFTGGGVAVALAAALVMHYDVVAGLAYTGAAAAVAFAVLAASFAAHFALAYRPGPGCSYHAPAFCAALADGSMGAAEATLKLVPVMLSSNFAIMENHSYSSPWWAWPVMGGFGTYLWIDGDRQLWTIGSPVVWWGGTAGVVAWLAVAARRPAALLWSAWLVVGWAVSYLPFAFIRRVMWNYHYFIPLLYSLAAGGVAAHAVAPNAVAAPLLIIAGAVACYWLYFPITYGTPLAPEALKRRMLPWWTY